MEDAKKSIYRLWLVCDIEGVGCDAFSKLEDLQDNVGWIDLRNFLDRALYNIALIALKMNY